MYNGRRTGQWRLTIEEKKRLLTTHIFGVDIDPQAVEVSKLSLLLKVLEGEDDQSVMRQMQLFQERALPNLADNIKCGNSLIGPDYFSGRVISDADELKRVNAFDWNAEFPDAMKAGGFDCIIGNPPYDVVEKERGRTSWPHAALVEYSRRKDLYNHALGGKLNLFRFFVIRATQFLTERGRFGMIVPLSLLGDISTSSTRKRVFAVLADVTAECFPQKDNPQRRVFRDAKLLTLVLTGRATTADTSARRSITVRTYRWNTFHDPHKECVIRLSDLCVLDRQTSPVPLVNEGTWKLCRKVHSHPYVEPLGCVKEITTMRGEINQTVYRKYITSSPKHARLLKGVEVGPFRLNTKLSQGSREWLDEREFLKHESARQQTRLTRIATQRITGVDERRRIVATIVDGPCYFADSTNSLHLASQDRNSLLYLLGLLNSRLYQWRFKLTSTNNNVSTNELDGMPYRRIEFKNKADVVIRDRIAARVEAMLSLNTHVASAKSTAQKNAVQRQIDATDAEIDRLVYELYGLTKKEIALVEEATAP